MLTWRIEVLHLKLTHPWKTARHASEEKLNFLLQVSDGRYNGFGEAAPSIRYGETPELLLQQYQVLLMAGLPSVKSMEDLLQLLLEHPPVNALRFAIESAYLHYYCQLKGIAVHQLLGQPAPRQQVTCCTLPTVAPGKVREFIQAHQLDRFRSLKVKVSPEQGAELVEEVLLAIERPLVLDGNESWRDPDELLVFLNSLDTGRVLFMEQPMPAGHVSEYAHMKDSSPIPLVADESMTDAADFELLQTQFQGVNIKLMKAGGYLNTVRLLQEARKHGLMVMLGSMVETSLGAWSAMQLSSAFDFVNLDGFLLLEREPFNLVREQGGVLYQK
ncbi:L-alanine-DL-glutamate epimerase-like enolase superfamily enzyme [Pontibacter ummariensis]|uniref:L-alanine-DL-glutamate epimerase n=1 Tax=Pontibacter ummariensis TaxID=1610492 RepID=A0A239BHG5_9BACT|nr:enolase C-terminal domain-like protein [Pontibacter ummariensis]PRY16547.1 L-alanine-DL-glutamate epimerase-like enolase superfamily enzyme [Pontibacter ummariensis]SNS07109.1 L-alanine-DL-glutamate epimerase [Pontibacter ummariensis]